MNAAFNHALRQSNTINNDLDALEQLPANTSTSASLALQGQISATLATFARTIGEYESLSNRETDLKKKNLAKERLDKFKNDIITTRQRLKNISEEKEKERDLLRKKNSVVASATTLNDGNSPYTRRANSFLSGAGLGLGSGSDTNTSTLDRQRKALFERRQNNNSNTNSSSTPDNPYGRVSMREGLVAENTSLGRTSEAIDGFLAMGLSVLGDLEDQRTALKRLHTKITGVASTLGISTHTISRVERRVREDKVVFYSCLIFMLITFYIIIKYLR